MVECGYFLLQPILATLVRFLQNCPQDCSFMNFACFVDWCYVWVKEQAEYFHINQQFFFTGK